MERTLSAAARRPRSALLAGETYPTSLPPSLQLCGSRCTVHLLNCTDNGYHPSASITIHQALKEPPNVTSAGVLLRPAAQPDNGSVMLLMHAPRSTFIITSHSRHSSAGKSILIGSELLDRNRNDIETCIKCTVQFSYSV